MPILTCHHQDHAGGTEGQAEPLPPAEPLAEQWHRRESDQQRAERLHQRHDRRFLGHHPGMEG